ncbi:MAG TPA: hypothetical protein VGQ38_09285 [Gaiellaceae bacterium]|nr:hypothetical protein [Gaiellaceae bacterium]
MTDPKKPSLKPTGTQPTETDKLPVTDPNKLPVTDPDKLPVDKPS